jgi:hypothetical protein
MITHTAHIQYFDNMFCEGSEKYRKTPIFCEGPLTKHFFKTLSILGDSQPEEAHRGPHVPAQGRKAELRHDGGAASGAWPN